VIDGRVLAPLLPAHLARQRWYGGGGSQPEVAGVRTLHDAPLLAQVLVAAGGATWQLLVGARPLEEALVVVEGKADAVIGEVETAGGRLLAYDATVDPELAVRLLTVVADGAEASRARVLGADQSNTSLVYDERLILKLFRRLGDGPNPDVEVGRALTDAGFPAVPPVVAEWHEGDVHLAVVHEFLADGVDGFQLALSSIHDLYASEVDAPEEAGGDFGPDARRLGTVTGELHLALARAFGLGPSEPGRWADEMQGQLARVDDDLDHAAIARRYDALRATAAGPAIRVHGDLHLGQVMRADAGWYVLDFEGEPARPVAERSRPSSALRDVAGVLRSMHYAVEVATRDYGYRDDPRAEALGRAWEARNASAFLAGYDAVDGVASLLPGAGERAVVLDAFLLDKAVYEVAYERSHRPDWVEIPRAAIARILAGTAPR
jgi:maltokinase